MIQRTGLHTCPSYTCLLSLEEKPTCFNTRNLSPTSVIDPVMPPMMPGSSPCVAVVVDEAYVRSNSPLTVVYDDDSEEEENDDYYDEQITDKRLLSSNLCESNYSIEPLQGSETSAESNDDRTTKTVKFSPRVNVASIPSHRDYPATMKRRIWASTEEIRINVVKAKMQLYLLASDADSDSDSDDDEGNENGIQERKFLPLTRMQKAL